MRSPIKIMAVILAASAALTASVVDAFATPANLARAGTDVVALAAPPAIDLASPAADCTDMQATKIAWVTLTADHHIDKQVAAYDSGTTDITPEFRYNCAPPNTTIVSVFSLDGLTIFTDKEALKERKTVGYYAYALETLDGSPLADGEWAVQYFNDKTLLTTGSIVVGTPSSDPAQNGTVTVQGVVQDQNSEAPIEGAVILVFNPGVKAQDFLQNGQKDSDVYTTSKSDSQGAFALPKKLVRHQAFGMLIVAQGYKSVGNDNFQVSDETDPVAITIAMTK